MIYELWIEKVAERDIEALDAGARGRVTDAIRRLATDPMGRGTKSLSGNLSSLRSLRVGPLRVCYEIDQAARRVTIVAVGHRGRVYADIGRRRGS
ncbi:MAG: type II toxin-antitoxin system RelE/ParE family toxin [candidate division WS1 bacterium]|nr:type II toxin-antitoxin system RelE/ParE family toxin [candidate division WS1 bacterium]